MSERHRAFVVDATRCINCKTCEIACKDAHHAASGVRMRKVRSFESGDFPSVLVTNITMSCNHCEDPLCASQCPAKAYSKRSDGVVIHDQSRCIGCGYCTWVCPYGAPQYDSAKRCIQKCDFCAEFVDAGQQPACVEACPTRAIAMAWLDEVVGDVNHTMNVTYLPSPNNSLPSTRYKVRKEARND